MTNNIQDQLRNPLKENKAMSYKKVVSKEISDRIMSKRQGLILIIGKCGTGKTAAHHQALELLASHGENHPGKVFSIESYPEYKSSPDLLTQVDAGGRYAIAFVIKKVLKCSPNVIGVDECIQDDVETLELIRDASMIGLVVATVQCETYDEIDASLRELNPLVLKAHAIDQAGTVKFFLDEIEVLRNQKEIRTRHADIKGLRITIAQHLSELICQLSSQLYWQWEKDYKTDKAVVFEGQSAYTLRHISVVSDCIKGLLDLTISDSSTIDCYVFNGLDFLRMSHDPNGSYPVNNQIISLDQINNLGNLLWN